VADLTHKTYFLGTEWSTQLLICILRRCPAKKQSVSQTQSYQILLFSEPQRHNICFSFRRNSSPSPTGAFPLDPNGGRLSARPPNIPHSFVNFLNLPLMLTRVLTRSTAAADLQWPVLIRRECSQRTRVTSTTSCRSSSRQHLQRSPAAVAMHATLAPPGMGCGTVVRAPPPSLRMQHCTQIWSVLD